jgi:DNA uptake protein ComE-like DNA-binding protein
MEHRVMKLILLAFALQLPAVAYAKESPRAPSTPATAAPAAPTGADETVRTLGRVNVNTATRELLLSVPGLDGAVADELIRERAQAPIVDLATVHQLPEEALSHLKTSGASDLRRIRQLPLVRLDQSPASASR